MQNIIDQFTSSFGGYLPRVVGAALLLLVAWVIARIVQAGVRRLLEIAQVERRFLTRGLLSNTLADLAYYLVLLLFLPSILSMLQLQALLEPVQTLINRMVGFLPNLFGAALILVVGLLVARIVRRLVTDLLAAVGVDTFGNRIGLAAGGTQLSDLIGLILFTLILIPTLTAALDALGLPSITQPISSMLTTFLAILPNLFGAALLMALAYAAGRILSSLVGNLLTRLGFNRLPVALGLGNRMLSGERNLADIVGRLIYIAILLFAGVEALRLLTFTTLANLMTEFLVLGGQVLLGLIVFAIGLFLANAAYRAVGESGLEQSGILAQAARISILWLAGAVALRQMGLANEIITLAFGLLLGAIALGAALAFGLGGREVAAKTLEDMRASMQKTKSE